MKRLARTDLAIHSRQLLHQSMWCGVVCGLAIVLTALNALPPVDVQYFVMGKVIASPIRAQALRQSLNESAESEPGQARLQRLTLLDEQPAVPASHLQASPPILLLGVVGIWQSRCTQERFQQWINSMALGSDSQRAVASTSTSHELRVARWEYEAAQHYRAHHEFLGGSDSDTADNNPGNREGIFQLASTGSSANPPGFLQRASEPNSAQIKQQLYDQVRTLQTRFEDLSHKSLYEQNLVAGKVEITDGPKIQPHCRPTPAWLSFSVLALGLASGLSAGWLHLRLQSGGVFDPEEVAAQLSRTGLPEVARVDLGTDKVEATDWLALAGQRASTAGRTSGRNLILLGESMLAVWCFVILGRICFDPLWRSLVLDSPLGALGRLLAGMP